MASTSGALAEFGAGAVFGSALLVSGVYSPAVITSQLTLSNFHMLETFMTASAVSAAVINATDRAGLAPIKNRPPRTVSLLAGVPFSANIVGGALLGLGMALTGACPGTVLVQIATGLSRSLYICAGGLAGGVLYSAVEPHILKAAPQSDVQIVREKATKAEDTVQSRLNVSVNTLLLAYELLCVAAVALSVQYAPKTTYGLCSPVVGGLMIGLAQAATLLMTKRTVGVSGAYGDIGNRLVGLFKTSGKGASTLTPSVLFALGILSGSAIVNLNVSGGSGIFLAPSIGEVNAFAGGMASIFGARLAGGCTSGHGISGMATFSTSSFLSVAAMFGGGILSSMFLN